MKKHTLDEIEPRSLREVIGQMAKELCGDRGLASLVMMMGVKQFYPLDAQEGTHLGGFAFKYNRRLTSNKSNLARIYANEDGTRTMEWLYMHPQTLDIDEVDRAEGILPEMMEQTWWEHTGCSVRLPWIFDACRIKFRLGRTRYTQGAKDTFTVEEIQDCFRRHSYGDWGDTCEEDKKVNEESLDKDNPGRLMSVYKYKDGRILWVITEWDRCSTTALLPDEY